MIHFHLHLDFETASRVDLKKAGASRYAQDPSTVVLAVAYAYDNGPVRKIILPTRAEMFDIIPASSFLLHAWNARFEDAILRHRFGIALPAENFSCTMQRALYWALPGKLEHAGPALRIPIVKDMAGHRLMLSMSKPKKDGSFWHEDPNEGRQKLDTLADYCARDVEAERAIADIIPKLDSDERAVSIFDAITNQRGIRLDLPFVDRLIAIAEAETRALNAECMVLTNAEVTSPGTQTDRLLKWFEAQGCPLPDVGKQTIAETLETVEDASLPDHVVQVLRLRQKVAKSSVHKLKAMKQCVDPDGRVRGTLQYYGARTGRWGGRLIQPQNFPRPEDYAPRAVSAVLKGMDNGGLRTFFDDPLAAVSTMLRSTIIPAPGRKLAVFDFAQIEARVLAWLAGQNDVLDVFARGEDVYEYAGRQIGGGRALGKVVTLACGYGMGPDKFVATAKGYGVTLTPEEAVSAVAAWRQANEKIRYFWWDMENATQMALGYMNPKARLKTWQGTLGGTCTVGRIQIKKVGDTLVVKKPNGGKLFYHNPRLVTSIDGSRMSFEFDGTVPGSGRWMAQASYGGRMVENVTQAVARDVMVEAAMRIAETPLGSLVLSVHDELVFETPSAGEIRFEAMKLLIEQRPAWAPDLPVKADGGFMDRYGK